MIELDQKNVDAMNYIDSTMRSSSVAMTQTVLLIAL